MILTANIRVVDSRSIPFYTEEEILASKGTKFAKKNPKPDDPHFEGSMLVKVLKKGKDQSFEMDDLASFKSFSLLPPGDFVVELLIGAFAKEVSVGKWEAAPWFRVTKILKSKPQA